MLGYTDDLTSMNRRLQTGVITLSTLLFLSPAAAFAHPGTSGSSFSEGFLHPLSGYDHVIAMVFIGIVATRIGGMMTLLGPLRFVLAMIAGGALGAAGLPVPFVEAGIAVSMIVLGIVTCLDIRISHSLLLGLSALFGLVHGHAHGTEMHSDAAALLYGSGFVVSTVALHVLGGFVGGWSAVTSWRYAQTTTSITGAVAAIIGLAEFAQSV